MKNGLKTCLKSDTEISWFYPFSNSKAQVVN